MWRNREGKLHGRKKRDGFEDGLLIVLSALFVKSDERRCLFCHECLLLASDDVLPMRRSVSIIARTREQNFFDLALCRKQLTSAFVRSTLQSAATNLQREHATRRFSCGFTLSEPVASRHPLGRLDEESGRRTR